MNPTADNMTEANAFALQDGTVLTGIPMDPPQDYDTPAYRRWPSREVQDAERSLFVAHAHFLLANAKRIFADSRMFLAPVNIQSGMAYTGALVKPCLGGYLEWWLNCPCSTRREGEKLSLTYFISGSALSGANASRSIANDGTKGGGTADLRTLAETFAKAMRRYADARRRFVANSLADVIVTLKGERDDAGALLRRTMLEQKVARLEAEVSELKDAAEEDAENLNALEKALQRVVVRECGDAIRDALEKCGVARNAAHESMAACRREEAEIRAAIRADPAMPHAQRSEMESRIRKLKRQVNVANGSAYRPVEQIFQSFAKREHVILPVPSELAVRAMLAKESGKGVEEDGKAE